MCVCLHVCVCNMHCWYVCVCLFVCFVDISRKWAISFSTDKWGSPLRFRLQTQLQLQLRLRFRCSTRVTVPHRLSDTAGSSGSSPRRWGHLQPWSAASDNVPSHRQSPTFSSRTESNRHRRPAQPSGRARHCMS